MLSLTADRPHAFRPGDPSRPRSSQRQSLLVKNQLQARRGPGASQVPRPHRGQAADSAARWPLAGNMHSPWGSPPLPMFKERKQKGGQTWRGGKKADVYSAFFQDQVFQGMDRVCLSALSELRSQVSTGSGEKCSEMAKESLHHTQKGRCVHLCSH